MFQRKKALGYILAVAILTLYAGRAAEAASAKNLTMIVPYPAGGPSDFVARQLQPLAANELGQTIIIENVGGAGGTIAMQRSLKPDGQTIALATPMELVLAPLSFSNANYNPQDFTVVAQMTVAEMVLLVRKDLPVKTIDELVLYGRTQTKPLTFGSTGNGSLYHLISEKFGQIADLKMLQVPYRGAAPVLQDLVSGQIDMVFMPLAGTVPGLIKDGSIKALGITSTSAHPVFSDIAPIARDAKFADMNFNLWSSVVVAKDTAPEIKASVHRAIYQAMSNAEVRRNLQASGSLIAPRRSLEELDALYSLETKRFQAIAASINLKPQ